MSFTAKRYARHLARRDTRLVYNCPWCGDREHTALNVNRKPRFAITACWSCYMPYLRVVTRNRVVVTA